MPARPRKAGIVVQPALYQRATCCGWQAAQEMECVQFDQPFFAGLAVMPSRGEFKLALLAKQ